MRTAKCLSLKKMFSIMSLVIYPTLFTKIHFFGRFWDSSYSRHLTNYPRNTRPGDRPHLCFQDAETILTQFSVGVGVLIDNSHKLGNDTRLVADDVGEIRQDLRRLEEQMDARQVSYLSPATQSSHSLRLSFDLQSGAPVS